MPLAPTYHTHPQTCQVWAGKCAKMKPLRQAALTFLHGGETPRVTVARFTSIMDGAQTQVDMVMVGQRVGEILVRSDGRATLL